MKTRYWTYIINTSARIGNIVLISLLYDRFRRHVTAKPDATMSSVPNLLKNLSSARSGVGDVQGID
jgi:hypothetical protein